MHNCCIIKYKNISNQYGNLVPIESEIDIPFSIKRIYYIYGVGHDISRGYHAHRTLHQILICLSGSLKVRVKSPTENEVYELINPDEGIYIGPMIWRELYEFSPDCVLLVLASDFYKESDYIRNYDFYLDEVKNRFG